MADLLATRRPRTLYRFRWLAICLINNRGPQPCSLSREKARCEIEVRMLTLHRSRTPHPAPVLNVLLPHRGSLWGRELVAGSPLRLIEGIFDCLACTEPYCLAGCDFDRLSALRIPTLACGPCRHIESAEAGDTDRLSSHERVENGVYDRL